MELIIILIAALLPAVILWWYIYKKDQRPEPKRKMLKAVLYGVMICLPVVIVSEFMTDIFLNPEAGEKTLYDGIADAFFVAAIPEESFKLLALWLVVRKNPFFDEHFDGIVYSVCVGMGFAGIENILYLLDEGEGWVDVAVLRALMSVPGHYAFAVLMGYYYSVYHFIHRSFSNKLMILVAPVLAHGTFDALLMTMDINVAFGFICFAACIFFCYRLHKMADKKIKKLLGEAS